MDLDFYGARQMSLLRSAKCPYDSEHLLTPGKVVQHLNNCRKQWDENGGVDMKICPYKRTHHVPLPEHQFHMTFCKENPEFARNKSPSPTRSNSISPQNTNLNINAQPFVPRAISPYQTYTSAIAGTVASKQKENRSPPPILSESFLRAQAQKEKKEWRMRRKALQTPALPLETLIDMELAKSDSNSSLSNSTPKSNESQPYSQFSSSTSDWSGVTHPMSDCSRDSGVPINTQRHPKTEEQEKVLAEFMRIDLKRPPANPFRTPSPGPPAPPPTTPVGSPKNPYTAYVNSWAGDAPSTSHNQVYRMPQPPVPNCARPAVPNEERAYMNADMAFRPW